MLAIETILYDLDMSIQQFAELYSENPSKLWKAVVPDRLVFVPNFNETRLEAPKHMQDKIDELVAAAPESKAFVRPSGTEDVVRIYAEAKTVEEMNQMGEAMAAYIAANFK